MNPRSNCSATSGIISTYVTGSSKLLVPGRVTAATGIPQGALSDAIEPALLLGQPDIQQISVGINSNGTIELDEKCKDVWDNNTHWVRALRLSDDCHSYNMQLRLQPAYQRPTTSLAKLTQIPKLMLQAVRPIEAGQELLLWFSEDILAMLQIVFLTPANIQGQKKYVCTRCSALYESPNPLKLHITLSCGKQTVTNLWEKLSDLMNENSFQNILKQEAFDFKLSPEPQFFRQGNAIDLTISNSIHSTRCDSNKIYRPYREPSAFKPFRKEPIEQPLPMNDAPMVLPMPFEPELQIHTPSYSDEAHIESLVSSLGKSKQGHICLYCGKCYSRKYGLKIHIRTHTGYKPLKCKFCSRPFGDPSNLNKHVRLHAEGNTPYKCDLCGKILVRRRDLERHLKSRHMIEMHPDMNILQDMSTDDIRVSDEDSRKSSS
ncbi:zinc finger protein 226 [Anoplophora glabripennis]|uniref:zinc finger protein 226 n=1 Tax=Anoplophora glabripennis TaxID=217634 RepID=UPI000C775023|nr:zinc finger protein 226 [Anoplophora glabripennis]